MIIQLILGLIPILLVFGAAFWYIRKSQGPGGSGVQEELLAEIRSLEEEIRGMIRPPTEFASSGEVEFLEKKVKEFEQELQQEKETLTKIEATLEGAQREVEEKENEQQELKISQKEDEQKMNELSSMFQDIETESTQLEQTLADSLKDLNELINELEENSKLRGLMEDLSSSLEDSASLLRELFLEYKTVTERCETISKQQGELEEEYTRLVEEQLAG